MVKRRAQTGSKGNQKPTQIDGLVGEQVPLKDLSPDPANVRRHGERNLEAIKASLRRFGQQKPIVVNAKGIVIAGNGTLEAARALGWETVAVVRSELAGAEATAFAIADNRTAELAEWDESALAQTLGALKADEAIDELVTGFSPEEIDSMLAGFDLDKEIERLDEHAAESSEGEDAEATAPAEDGYLSLLITGSKETIASIRTAINAARQEHGFETMAEALWHLIKRQGVQS